MIYLSTSMGNLVVNREPDLWFSLSFYQRHKGNISCRNRQIVNFNLFFVWYSLHKLFEEVFNNKNPSLDIFMLTYPTKYVLFVVSTQAVIR